MINDRVSVVTVTKNNASGLRRTLDSLVRCNTKPHVIYIIDGASVDSTASVVASYANLLNIIYQSGKDSGIYDAMNRGLRLVKTALVHYLNAGDYVDGDVYAEVAGPCLLPVYVFDPLTSLGWIDRPKLLGYGYCHQGIIFSATHPEFDLRFKIAGDFDLISKLFPDGLAGLDIKRDCTVFYELGGISSKKSIAGAFEIACSARRNMARFQYVIILAILISKTLIPRIIRRRVAFLLGRLKPFISKKCASDFHKE
jgi:glycosyltransferase involved in cell wall biosynthesis